MTATNTIHNITKSDRFRGGTEHYHRVYLYPKVLYTDGVQALILEADAWWLMNIIMSECTVNPALLGEKFQVWNLTVHPDPLSRDSDMRKATLTCEDGNERMLYTHDVYCTLFPPPGVTLWCSDDGQNKIIYLPIEH